MADDDDLLTTNEVAALARAPVSTVRYWRHMGVGFPELPAWPASSIYRRCDVRRSLDEVRLSQSA